jgi:hypothetical protein
MTVRAYSIPWGGRPGHLLTNYYNDSTSNKVGGKVLLRDTLHTYSVATVTAYSKFGTFDTISGAEVNPSVAFTDFERNRVKAMLAGKLHRGDASMGMTLASCGQAATMIVSRFNQINDLMGLTRRRRARRAIRPRPGARSLARDILEVEFGWRPFISDIAAALSTIAQADMPPVRFRASVRMPVYEYRKEVGNPERITSLTGHKRITATQTYSVSNPNVWLLNQLGLLNPFQVAWDKVPWSWVVNMFVNANQLISSVTDTFGLSNGGGSLTYSQRLFQERIETWYKTIPSLRGVETCNVLGRRRNREALTSLVPTLEFRMPTMNWELAMIASALAVQRSQSLS